MEAFASALSWNVTAFHLFLAYIHHKLYLFHALRSDNPMPAGAEAGALIDLNRLEAPGEGGLL